MKFDRFFRALGPIIAVAMAAGLSACDGNVSINGEKGKPLAEIDMTGTPPEELVLLGPDEVRVTQGDKLAITVEGDKAVTDKLRFTLKDGTLGVLRSALSGAEPRVTLMAALSSAHGGGAARGVSFPRSFG